MAGRPSSFTPEIANEICDRLAKGESLKRITGPDRDGFMPSETTVINWLSRGESGEEPYAAFLVQYARAREAQADTYFAEVVDIADEAAVDAVAVARNRLRVDARKWTASKLAPKKYGDRQVIEHEGSVTTLTDEQLDAKLAELMAKLNAD